MVNKSNKIFSSLQGISILSSQYPHGCNHYHSKQESIMHTNCYYILEHIKALLTTQSLTCAEISPSGSQRDQESSRTAFVQNTACPSRFEPNRHVTHHGTAVRVTGTGTITLPLAFQSLGLASQSFPPHPLLHACREQRTDPNRARTYASRLGSVSFRLPTSSPRPWSAGDLYIHIIQPTYST